MAYSIASIKGVLEQARQASQGSAKDEESAALKLVISDAETRVEDYLVSPSVD